MSSHIRPVPDAGFRQTGCTRCQFSLLLIATALSIQGCAMAPPRPVVGPDAADPNVRVPTTVYGSALGDFRDARLSEPAGWRERNDGAAPQPKKDGP
jgi:hypothetical protein